MRHAKSSLLPAARCTGAHVHAAHAHVEVAYNHVHADVVRTRTAANKHVLVTCTKITHHVAWARLQSTTRMTVTRARPHAHVAQHTHGAHMTNARKCMNVPARQCGMYTHAQVSTANARTLAHASVTRTHHVHDGAVHTATTAARCTNARATARHVQRTAHQLHIRTH